MKAEISHPIEADLREIIAINEACLPEHYDYPFWRQNLVAYNMLFYIVKIEGKIVGYVMCKLDHLPFTGTTGVKMEDVCIILSIATLPEYRRKGVGDLLIREIMLRAKNIGLKYIVLQVRISNKNAVQFYKNRGFTKLQDIPKYYDNEDGILMVATL